MDKHHSFQLMPFLRFLFCFLTNQQCVLIFITCYLSTGMGEQVPIKINRKELKDESPSFGLGFDSICGTAAVIPAN